MNKEVLQLIRDVGKDLFLISDLHFGHKNILLYEPIRLEYLLDFDADVIDECSYLLDELSKKSLTEIKSDDLTPKILKYLIDKHDEMMIEKWNSVISDDDFVLFLGDFTFNKFDIVRRLKGKKIFLLGNHDNKSKSYYLRSGWDYVVDDVILDLGEEQFVFEEKKKYLNGIFMKDLLGYDILFSHYPVFNPSPYDNEFQNIVEVLENTFNVLNFNLNIYGHTHSKKSRFEDSISVSVENLFSMLPQKLETLLKLNYKNIKE